MNETETQTESKKRGSNAWILVIFLALAVSAAAYFFYRFNQRGVERVQLIEKAHADSIHISDLDAKYTATLDTLSSYKGLNTYLDSIIEIKESELSDCRSNFLSMVRRNRINEEQYKKQLAGLDSLRANFQYQISQLQAENKLMMIQRDSLGRLVLAQSDTIGELSDSNNLLSKRVLIGSLLKPTTITGAGTRTKGNGKEVTTSKASKATQLRVCFNVPANDIARPDKKIFNVRIIGPDGNILSGKTARSISKAETGKK